MASIYIYNQSGNQIYPPVDYEKSASDKIQSFIKHAIPFYANSAENQIIARIAGVWEGAVSTRENHYVAVYSYSDEEFDSKGYVNLFHDFSDKLDNLDQGSQWNAIDSPPGDSEKEEFYIPWFLKDTRNSELRDIGLEKGQQLATKRVVDEGHQLDIGMADYEATTIAVSYLLRETKRDIDICISPVGRHKATTFADVIIDPTKEKNMEPLNENTANILRDKLKRLEDMVIKDYKSEFDEYFSDILNDSSLNFWEKHAELERIIHSISNSQASETGQEDPKTDPGKRLSEILNILQSHGSFNQDEDLQHVSASRLEHELDELRQQLRDQIATYKTNALSLTEEFFDDILTDVDAYEREEAHSIIEEMIKIVDGNRSGVSKWEEVKKFTDLYQWYSDTHLLNGTEKSQIEFKTRLETERDDYVEAEQTDILDDLKDWIDTKRMTLEDQYTRLENLKKRLDSNQRGSNAVESSVQLPSGTLERVYNNTILNPDHVETIENKTENYLNDRKDQIANTYESNKKDELEEIVDTIKEESENPIRRFKNLSAAENYLSDLEFSPEEDSAADTIVDFCSSIDNIDIISSAKEKTIRNHGIRYINNHYADLRVSMKDYILDECKKSIKSISQSGVNLSTVGADLKTIREYIDTGNYDNVEIDSSSENVEKIRNRVVIVTSGDAHGKDYFNSSNSIQPDDILDEIDEKLEAKIKELRKNRIQNLKTSFTDVLENFFSKDEIQTYEKVIVLENLYAQLDESYQSQLPDGRQIQPEKDQLAKLKSKLYTYVNEVTDDGEDLLYQSDLKNIRDSYISIVKDALPQAREDLADSIVDHIQDTISTSYMTDPTEADNIDELVEATETLQDLVAEVNDFDEADHDDIKQSSICDSTVEQYRVLPSAKQNVIWSEVAEYLDSQIDSIENTLSEQVRNTLVTTIRNIGSNGTSSKDMLVAYAELCGYFPDEKWEFEGTGNQYEDLSTYPQHLNESDYERVHTKLRDDRQEELTSYLEEFYNRFENSLDTVESRVDAPKVAFNSIARYIDGDKDELDKIKFREVQTVVDDIQTLQDDGIISENDLTSINTELRDRIADRQSQMSIVGLSPMVKKSLLVAVILIAGAAIGVGAFGSGPGDSGSETTSDFRTSAPSFGTGDITISQTGDEIQLKGSVTGAESVIVALNGSDHSRQKESIVSDGTFQASFAALPAGGYDIFIHPPENSTDADQYRTHVVAGQRTETLVSSFTVAATNGSIRVDGVSPHNITRMEVSVISSKTPSPENDSFNTSFHQTLSVTNGIFDFGPITNTPEEFKISFSRVNSTQQVDYYITVPPNGTFEYRSG